MAGPFNFLPFYPSIDAPIPISLFLGGLPYNYTAMSNSHGRKYIFNLFAGLVLITAGLGLLGYASFNQPKAEWLYWTLASIIITVAGLLLLSNGIVHKVKADLIRRQKSRSRSERSDAD